MAFFSSLINVHTSVGPLGKHSWTLVWATDLLGGLGRKFLSFLRHGNSYRHITAKSIQIYRAEIYCYLYRQTLKGVAYWKKGFHLYYEKKISLILWTWLNITSCGDMLSSVQGLVHMIPQCCWLIFLSVAKAGSSNFFFHFGETKIFEGRQRSWCETASSPQAFGIHLAKSE